MRGWAHLITSSLRGTQCTMCWQLPMPCSQQQGPWHHAQQQETLMSFRLVAATVLCHRNQLHGAIKSQTPKCTRSTTSSSSWATIQSQGMSVPASAVDTAGGGYVQGATCAYPSLPVCFTESYRKSSEHSQCCQQGSYASLRLSSTSDLSGYSFCLYRMMCPGWLMRYKISNSAIKSTLKQLLQDTRER